MSDPAPMPTRRGRIIAVLAGFAVVAILGAGALYGVENRLEARAKYRLYEEPVATRAIRLKEHPPNLDVVRRPGPEYLARAHDLPDIEYRFRTGPDGFIQPSAKSRDSSGRDLLIAFLGGSTTECVYVPEDARFPAAVRDLFLKRSVRAEVINSGVSGNNVMHSVNILVNKILPYRPDYVVLMHAWNDLGYLLAGDDYWNVDDQLRSLVIEHRVEPSGVDLKRAFKYRLPYTYNLVKDAWLRLSSSGVAGRSDSGAPAPSRIGEDVRERVVAQFEAALTTFVAVSRSWGATPVLMTQAAFLPPRSEIVDRYEYLSWLLQGQRYAYEDYAEMHGRLNDVIRRVADKLEVPLIDLARRLSAPEYIYDPVHLNEPGSRLAAELIFAGIASLYDGAPGRASADATGE